MRVFDIGSKDGPQQVTDRVLTIPNLLSLARLLILPVIYVDLASGRLGRGTLLAFVFGSTDWLDGYLARRLDQVTRLGKLLDPISDRVFFVVVGIGLVVGGVVPLWAIAVLVARDVLVSAAGLVLLATRRPTPEVTRLGKAATFGIAWAMLLFALSSLVGEVDDPQPLLRALAWIVYWSNIVLSYAAAADYARIVFGRRPSPATPVE